MNMQSGRETRTDLEWAEALARYIAGESSPEERTAVRTWAASLSGRVNAADAFSEVWNNDEFPDPIRPSAGWDAIAQRTGIEHQERTERTPDVRRSGKFRIRALRPLAARPARWFGVGAGAALGIGLLVYVLRPPGGLAPSSSTPSTSSGYTVHTTLPGQRTSIELTDGTRVLLNVASTLEISRNFGVSNRIVRLRGQAVFEVKHAEAHPFIVDAVGTRTTVLGTTFGVRAYDANVRVAVQDGKVAIAACNAVGADAGCDRRFARAVITEREIATVTPAGRIRTTAHAAIESDFAFTTGRLLLTGERLGDVVDALSRWYDIDFQIADSIVANKIIEGSFPVGTLDALVQSLSVLLNVHVQRNGRTILLSATESPSARSFGRDRQDKQRATHNFEKRAP